VPELWNQSFSLRKGLEMPTNPNAGMCAAPEALAQMEALLTNRPDTRWAAYVNAALDSHNCGHLQFLAVGPGNTFAEPPKKYPFDTASGMGWRYLFAGWVDMDTGEVKPVTAMKGEAQ